MNRPTPTPTGSVAARARTLLSQGMPAPDVALELGVHRSYIYQAAKASNIHINSKVKACRGARGTIAQIHRAQAAGWPDAAICHAFNISPDVLLRLTRAAHLDTLSTLAANLDHPPRPQREETAPLPGDAGPPV